MSRRCRGILRYAVVTLVLGAISACAWFPESTFYLSPQSRLPRWIDGRGIPSSELTVRIDYIGPLWGTPYARITVKDNRRNLLERIDVPLISSVGVQTADGAPARGSYPNYQVHALNGAVDIFEQRRAVNTLYMCDDVAVWSKLAPGAAMPPNNLYGGPRQALIGRSPSSAN